MTKLLLIRHGESMANSQDVYVGITESPLTELGIRQARITAKYIASNYTIEKIYTSDLSRAFDTGKAVGEALGLDVECDIGLREMNGGLWENMSFSELREKYPREYDIWLNNIGDVSCPGGESVKELQDRFTNTLTKIADGNDGKTVVISTHSTPIMTFQCFCRKKPLDYMKYISWVPNASVTVVNYDNGEFYIEAEGYDAHLEEIKKQVLENV